MTKSQAVVCRNVTKEFGTNGTRTQVLRGIDWQVSFGEMTLLVGPSGCGKTTLISVIVVTHDPRVYEFANTIAHMEDGVIRRIERNSGVSAPMELSTV